MLQEAINEGVCDGRKRQHQPNDFIAVCSDLIKMPSNFINLCGNLITILHDLIKLLTTVLCDYIILITFTDKEKLVHLFV